MLVYPGPSYRIFFVLALYFITAVAEFIVFLFTFIKPLQTIPNDDSPWKIKLDTL